jgi:hypothetical protein
MLILLGGRREHWYSETIEQKEFFVDWGHDLVEKYLHLRLGKLVIHSSID